MWSTILDKRQCWTKKLGTVLMGRHVMGPVLRDEHTLRYYGIRSFSWSRLELRASLDQGLNIVQYSWILKTSLSVIRKVRSPFTSQVQSYPNSKIFTYEEKPGTFQWYRVFPSQYSARGLCTSRNRETRQWPLCRIVTCSHSESCRANGHWYQLEKPFGSCNLYHLCSMHS